MIIAPTPLFLLASLPSAETPALDLFAEQPFELELPASYAQRARRTSFEWGPDWVLSFSGYYVDPDYDTFNGQTPEDDGTYGLDLVIYNWDNEAGMGLEFGLMYGTYTVPPESSGAPQDDVTVFRGLLGIRIADRGPDDPIYVPFARGGLIYREDDGDASAADSIFNRDSDSSDFGWYLGGGIDFRLGSHVAITPSVMFTSVSGTNAEDWLYGIALGIAF